MQTRYPNALAWGRALADPMVHRPARGPLEALTCLQVLTHVTLRSGERRHWGEAALARQGTYMG
jgi:hypothetical protein